MSPLQSQTIATKTGSTELRTPGKPITLSKRYLKVRLNAEGDLIWAFSKREGRLLFGRESVQVHKVQAGVRVKGAKRDCRIKLSPDSAEFVYHPFESFLFSETFETLTNDSTALVRRVRVSNLSNESIRLLFTILDDPTTINFRRATDPPGVIGVNAFNRSDHVVMDDLGDDAEARVLGTTPVPRGIFMTRDKTRALEILERGELPESTAGMSGPVIILTQHVFDLAPQGTAEVILLSVHNPSRLEGALSAFKEIAARGVPVKPRDLAEVSFASSSPDLNFAFSWALAALRALEAVDNLLDRLETIPSLSLLHPLGWSQVVGDSKRIQFRNGSLPHSLDQRKEGVLETGIFLMHASLSLILSRDTKQARLCYPTLKRSAKHLIEGSGHGLLRTDSSLPQGWRRNLAVGYPKAILTEVNLTVARALLEFSSLSSLLGKGAESAQAKEACRHLLRLIEEELVEPDSGDLALNIDGRGKLRRDESIDQVVACYRYDFNANISSSFVRRLLEKDYETGFGPRTVPTSSPTFANGSYMEGQTGGYWTRAALAHAILSYRVGYPAIGSAQLCKVSKLVRSGLGGLPGEFPYWLDPESLSTHGDGNDIVAASRLVETVIFGELGLSEEGSLSPPKVSELSWLFLAGLCTGERSTVFIGRENGKVQVVTTSKKLAGSSATSHMRFERLDSSNDQVVALQFTNPGQLICIGNISEKDSSSSIIVPLREEALSSELVGRVEEFDLASESWIVRSSIRLLTKMRVNVSVRPRGWKMLRISPSQPSSLS